MPFTVTNNLDDVAIYIGLKRLPGEIDELFAARIKRFSKIKYGIDTTTSILSIIEQCGLLAKKVAIVECNTPFTCEIDKDRLILESFSASGNEYVSIFINIFSDPASSELGNKIKDQIDRSSIFSIEILDNDFYNLTKDNIFRNKNYTFVQDIVSEKRTVLNAEGVLKGSISSDSGFVTSQKASVQDIKLVGDYFFDDEIKYLELFSDPKLPFEISYTSYKKIFTIYKLDINLLPLEIYSKYGLSDKFIDILDKFLEGKSLGVSA